MYRIAIYALNCSSWDYIATNTEKVLQIHSQAKKNPMLEMDCMFKKET